MVLKIATHTRFPIFVYIFLAQTKSPRKKSMPGAFCFVKDDPGTYLFPFRNSSIFTILSLASAFSGSTARIFSKMALVLGRSFCS